MKKHNKSESEIKELVETYTSLIFRVSYCILGNRDDAEDAVQDAFLKYLTKAPEFESEEHRKAWLIRVATNISKNMARFNSKHAVENLDELRHIGISDDDRDIFELIMRLPAKYKIVLDFWRR